MDNVWIYHRASGSTARPALALGVSRYGYLVDNHFFNLDPGHSLVLSIEVVGW